MPLLIGFVELGEGFGLQTLWLARGELVSLSLGHLMSSQPWEAQPLGMI